MVEQGSSVSGEHVADGHGVVCRWLHARALQKSCAQDSTAQLNRVSVLLCAPQISITVTISAKRGEQWGLGVQHAERGLCSGGFNNVFERKV